MHMRKKIFTILIAMIISTGCVKTPNESYVVKKSEGLSEEAVANAMGKGETKVSPAPKHWTDSIVKGNGKVTIESDIDINTTRLPNTPVLKLKKKDLDTNMLKKLTEYLLGDPKKLYHVKNTTHKELESIRAEIQNQEGDYGNPDRMYWNQQLIQNIDDLLSEKDTNGKLEALQKVDFNTLEQSLYSIVYEGKADKESSITNKKIFFSAQTKTDTLAYIFANKRDEEYGIAPKYEYTIGTYFTKKTVDDAKQNISRYKSMKDINIKWLDQYEVYVKQMEEAVGKSTLEKNKYENKAKKILSEMGIDNLNVIESYPSTWIPENLEWNKMKAKFSEAEGAYTVVFGKSVKGLPSYISQGGTTYDDLPEQVYKPPFDPEVLNITFIDSQVVDFRWENMSKVENTIAENTNLLQFDEIKERFADHVLYAAIALDKVNDKDSQSLSHRYVIRSVDLEYSNINAFDEPQNAWIVPVWVFKMDWYLTVKGNQEILREPETVVINALDGGYVGN